MEYESELSDSSSDEVYSPTPGIYASRTNTPKTKKIQTSSERSYSTSSSASISGQSVQASQISQDSAVPQVSGAIDAPSTISRTSVAGGGGAVPSNNLSVTLVVSSKMRFRP